MADIVLKPTVITGRAPKRAAPAAVAQWNPIERPIDKVWFGGMWTPGIADVSGASAPRKWEELGGYGLSGAMLIYRGWGLSHFSVKLRLYSTEDWKDWHAFKQLVARPPRGKRPTSIEVAHPLLEDLQIRAVVVEDVLVADQTGDGEWTIELKLIAFRMPKYSLARPDGTASETPLDEADLAILANSKQIADLARALGDNDGGDPAAKVDALVQGVRGLGGG
jgi:hypothetical protein